MTKSKTIKVTLSRVLAPEEIRCGQFVAVMHTMCEYLPLGPLFDLTTNVPESLATVRVLWLPQGDNTPMRVRAVCLPFVLVEYPSGDWQSLDMRRLRLAKLKKSYANEAWARLSEQARRDRQREKDGCA